jgi:hypothetical protein
VEVKIRRKEKWKGNEMKEKQEINHSMTSGQLK